MTLILPVNERVFVCLLDSNNLVIMLQDVWFLRQIIVIVAGECVLMTLEQ